MMIIRFPFFITGIKAPKLESTFQWRSDIAAVIRLSLLVVHVSLFSLVLKLKVKPHFGGLIDYS